jgi:enoyl-[acyl-carrier protein] reductase II
MREDAADLARIIVESGIKIVFTSAGNPAKFTSYFHDNGIIVAHVVPSLKLALKAQDRGVDVIVGEGFEAGGHNGYEEIATLPLIPRLADNIKLPLIAAGGIRDGRGILAMLALGADGAQLGTRFACSIESSASEAYKNSIVGAKEPATILTLKKLSPTRMLLGNFASECIAAGNSGMNAEELQQLLGEKRAKRGTFEGDLIEGIMEAGEVAGDIKDIPSVEVIISELVTGMILAAQKINSLCTQEI